MSEHLEPRLPLETDENMPLYFLPEFFVQGANKSGWLAHIQNGVDGDESESHYVMARVVPWDFDDSNLLELQSSAGIIDEDGEVRDGYGLWLEKIGNEVERSEDFPFVFINETNRLVYEFKGVPTAKTLDGIEVLLGSFQPESKAGEPSLLAKALGWVALRMPKW